MKKAAAIEPQEFVHLSKTCTKCVEPVKEPLRQSGYSACDQDEGLQLPCEYVDGEPCLSNTVEWAVACERDQWSRAIAGRVNVAPRHLSAEAETLLSATLIHEGMHGRNKPSWITSPFLIHAFGPLHYKHMRMSSSLDVTSGSALIICE
uniref:Uncharacterized protein n=1 Tax=Physcomitrium patens TaxID=3218 RepID=A0A7I3ZQZ8_PHYPA